MLTNAELGAFLDHGDGEVRSFAAEVLAEVADPAPVNAEDAQRGIDRFGGAHATHVWRAMVALPHSDRSLQWMLEKLASTPAEAEAHLRCVQALEGLDFDLLLRNWPIIREAEQVPEPTRRHLEARLGLADQSPEDSWDQLMDLAVQNRGKCLTEFHSNLIDHLVEAAARGGESMAQRALAMVGDDSAADWREWFAVSVLGQLRYKPAVGSLVDRGKVLEDDDLIDEVVKTLGLIGGRDTLVRAMEAFPEAMFDYRITISRLPVILRFPENERLLLDLLEQETDESVRTDLLIGLAEICPTDVATLEVLRSAAIEGSYDPVVVDLEELLLPLGTMVGYEPPEAARWRKSLRKRRARQASLRGKFNRGIQELRALEALASEQSPPVRPAALDEDDIPYDCEPTEPWPVVETIRRELPKTGRNDPCPCGSGRKYKKCCMRKTQETRH